MSFGSPKTRPRQRQPLPLAAGEPRAGVGQPGLVALRQPADQLVHAGEPRGGDDVGHVGVAEAGDVLAHLAVEEQRVLRQVADRLAEAAALVREGALPVEEDAARGRRPEADDEPRQRRLAGARRADDAEELAALDLERDVAQRAARSGPPARSRRGRRRAPPARSSTGVGERVVAPRASTSRMRSSAARASNHCRQPSISCSKGRSSRELRTAAATMVPAEAWWLMTRMAPAQTLAICSPIRSALRGGGQRLRDRPAALDAVERLRLGAPPAPRDGGQHPHRDDDLGVADRRGGLGVDVAGGEASRAPSGGAPATSVAMPVTSRSAAPTRPIRP